MELRRYGLVLAGLLIIALVAVAPVAAEVVTIDPGAPGATVIQDAVTYLAGSPDASDTLILNPGTYSENGIVISKNIIIRANTSYGHSAIDTIIDGKSTAPRIFTVNAGVSLTIDSLTLRNGRGTNSGLVTDNGGAIRISGGTLTVTSSAFTGCSAGMYGGAIYSVGGSTVSIAESSFLNCQADEDGGAIMNNGGVLDITSTSFTTCSASNGGAIGSFGTLSVTSSGFSGCTATNLGGAIESLGTATIAGSSTFTGCTAPFGGAIQVISGTLAITGSTFSSCTASEGGAINNNGGTVTIGSSTFSACSATINGGAIYNNGGTVTIGSSTFSACSASADGGAICNVPDSPGDALTISTSSITGCSAGGDGGAIRNVPASPGLGTVTIHFSRIYNDNTGTAIANSGNAIDATDNWWGTNSNPSGFINGLASYTPWLELGGTATPSSIAPGLTSTIRANLTYDSSGNYHDPAGDHVPDDIPVLFALTDGIGSISLTDGRTADGANTTIFTSGPGTTGSATVRATIDDQPVDVVITIPNDVPVISGILPATGPEAGGTVITITGSGFIGATTVMSGATPAAYSVDSDAQITATSPAGTGIVDITVTTPGGTSVTSPADQFTYVPAPAVTGISPTTGRIIGGEMVTITGTGFTGATAVMFGTTASPSYSVDMDTQITAVAPPHATGTVDVTVTTPWGTSAVVPADRFTYTNVPVVTGVSPSSGPTGGTLVTITGMGFDGATDVRFGPAPAAGFIVDNDMQITAFYLSGTAGTTVDITVTTPEGTSATGPAGRFTYYSQVPTVSQIWPNTGPVTGGTIVDIGSATLDGFGDITIVMFGFTPAPAIIHREPGLISVISPPHAAGAVDITVTGPGGTSAFVAADRFTYTGTYVPAYSQSQSGGSNDDGPPAIIPPRTVTVNIGGNSGAGRAIVTGTKLSELIVTGTVQDGSASNMTPPPGIVYQYISLVPARYGTITNAVINFSVPQSWLDGDHIAPGSIVLYRQAGNSWTPLPTTLLYTKDGTVYYSAVSPGFSLFVIAGTPAEPAPVTTMKTQATFSSPVREQAPVQAAVTQKPVTTQTTAPPDSAAKPSAPLPLMNIILAITAVAVLAAGGFLARRWWIRQQNPALFRDYD